MARVTLPPDPEQKMLEYTQFRGVDFSSTPGDVAEYRSPDAINMVADLSGRPVKRFGYACRLQLDGRINGVHRLVRYDKERGCSEESLLIHAGERLYNWDKEEESTSEIYAEMADVRSFAYQMEGYLWLVDGKRLLRWDGEEDITPADTLGYVPTTRMGATPEGGGAQYEQRNLFSAQAMNLFIGDGEAVEYHLNTQELDSVDAAEILTEDGDWEEAAHAADLEKGMVTFEQAPGEPPVRGEDNVRITFSKEMEDAADKINKCRFGIQWGVGGNNRLILAGNPEYPNMDFTSEMSNPTQPAPTNFPELNYSLVGQESSGIVGYRRVGGDLAVLKEENDQDATMYLRTADLTEMFEILLRTREGVAGVGGISPHAMAELRDEQLFLTAQGVFSLAESGITSKRYAQPRSEMINRKLCAEPQLHKAIMVEYDDYLYVGVNGHVYVADASQRTAQGRGSEQYQYEWYYFENVPARIWFKLDGELWFGTEDGKLMRFFKEGEPERYRDDGQPIYARWTTPEIGFDTYSRFKTLRRFYSKLLPAGMSSAKIWMRRDGGWELIDEVFADIFEFENINFNRFTFNMDREVYIMYTKLKEKRITTTQFRLDNNVLNEPFGLTAISLYYDLKRPARI